MTLLFILFLLISSILLYYFKRKKSGITLLFLTGILFFSITNGFIPKFLLLQLQAPFLGAPKISWQDKNAIVLLGAGAIERPGTQIIQPTLIAYSRIVAATRLYNDCKRSNHQCTIIISGGDAQQVGKSEAEVYQKVLLDLGAKSTDLLLETHSLNTFKNAEWTSAILRKNNFTHVFLVTSGIHLKRALLYFNHFAVAAYPVLADYLAAQQSIMPIGYNMTMTDFALHEYLGIIRFHLYNFLGWNSNASVAGAL